jgi:hypothetical protein
MRPVIAINLAANWRYPMPLASAVPASLRQFDIWWLMATFILISADLKAVPVDI